MAKKKANIEELDENEGRVESKEEIRERITREIEKELGKGVVVSGSDIIDRPRMVIPFSPAIDQIIGGGIPEGSWVILSGLEKCGKSLSAMHFAKNCQNEKYGKRNIYYLNIEGRLKARDIKGIKGVNPNRISVVESTPEKILSSQDYLKTAEKILHTDNGCLLIIDSISSLCEERELTGGIGTETRGGGAKLVSQFTSQMANVVPVKGSIVICILHLMANTSGYGSPYTEKGGRAIQYQSDIKLINKTSPEMWAVTKGADPFGQIVTWKCTTAALGPPGRTCQSYIRFGEGIDEIQELIVDAKDTGLITTAGSWVKLDYLANHLDLLGISEWNDENAMEIGARTKSADKMRQSLINHPEWLDILKDEVKKILS